MKLTDINCLLAAAIIAMTMPAQAIIDGDLDGEDHPCVGLVVMYDAEGYPLWRCSGTLIEPNVFLTAAHCTSPDPFTGQTPVTAAVYFDANVPFAHPFSRNGSGDWHDFTGYPFTGGLAGCPVANPFYMGITPPNTHDVGVVIMDEDVVLPPGVECAVVPPLGYLDELASRRGKALRLDVVGYGLQYIRSGPLPHNPVQTKFLQAYPIRLQAQVSLLSLNNSLVDGYGIMHSGDSGKGNDLGGSCFGDSGGPIFEAGTNIVVGIVSFGLNQNCTGVGFAYRTDIEETKTFIDFAVCLDP